ncbi:MAG: DUF1446 domain-containing protein [Silvibacterium sp.]|nr:DUF1446 domain-containing protein [Silvibacterium sp.]MBV8438443.1 DUF1446 domain-containing protein [Silvibacterium sp.]
MKQVRLGSGAGYSGDRIDPAVELARAGNLGYLVFECLAERTIAIAQQNKRTGASEGYDPLLLERMQAVLPDCVRNGVKIISNMGAANPVAAAKKTQETARALGLTGLRIAAITGDDVLSHMTGDYTFMETGDPVSSVADRIVSANAYLGAGPIVEALAGGADVVLTGRAADPSLFLAPLIHEFGWDTSDWNLLGHGTVIGHLLECAGQLTGGYFADPGYKDVPGLARLGFPLAEVSTDGSAILTKVEGSGGCLSRATCAEQLLYEIQDPASYMTPDVVADFSNVRVEDLGHDRVRVTGGAGKQRPETLKVSVGFQDGWIGEGQISYAGLGAVARAQLAEQILAERMRPYSLGELRFDLIGMNSIHGRALSHQACEPWEVRLRVIARGNSRERVAIVPREVEALYTNGPAGGGGVSTSIRETIAILSTLIPRELPQPVIHMEVS